MPDYAFVIALVAFAAVALIAFRILKGILKTAIAVAVIAAVATSVAGFLVIADANDLREKLGTEKTLFLLVDSSEVISGVELESEGAPRIISQQQLEGYAASIASGDFSSIKGDYYKAIIIDAKSMEPSDAEKARSSGYVEERAKYLIAARNRIFSDPLVLVREYKNGNVLIYEETPVFRAIRLMPTPIIRFVAEKFVSSTRQVVADAFG